MIYNRIIPNNDCNLNQNIMPKGIGPNRHFPALLNTIVLKRELHQTKFK
jgi:hypothetical protein